MLLLLAALALLTGCLMVKVTDVTESGGNRYAMLRKGPFVTTSDLFLIDMPEASTKLLFYPGDLQLTPFTANDFKGQPLRCRGFGRGAHIIAVIPTGTHVTVERIIERDNPESGFHNRVFAAFGVDGIRQTNVEIHFLFDEEGGGAPFHQRLLVPNPKYLKLETPETD